VVLDDRLHDVTDPATDGRPTPGFLITKEHRRFTEFADACRRERYIGLCYGPPGVGKTPSARQYTHWDTITPAMMDRFGAFPDPFEDRQDAHPPGPEILAETRSVLWTPNVTVSPRQVDYDVPMLCRRFNVTVERHLSPQTDFFGDVWHVELLIVDEADRLKTTGLEQLRDCFDRRAIGLILIGMPGIGTIRELAGHADSRTTTIYTAVSPDRLEHAIAERTRQRNHLRHASAE
jgi:AAA domain